MDDILRFPAAVRHDVAIGAQRLLLRGVGLTAVTPYPTGVVGLHYARQCAE